MNIPKMSDLQKECFALAKANKYIELEVFLNKNPHLIESLDETGKTMLHCAAARNHVDTV